MLTTYRRIFHLTYAARDRQPLFPGEAQRRAAVRALVRVGGKHTVLFCLVDDHARTRRVWIRRCRAARRRSSPLVVSQ
jgi:hypothetical protein